MEEAVIRISPDVHHRLKIRAVHNSLTLKQQAEDILTKSLNQPNPNKETR